MKVKIFNEYGTSAEGKANDWLIQHKNIKVEDIKLSSCCTSSGSVYTQVMIIYTEVDNSIKL